MQANFIKKRKKTKLKAKVMKSIEKTAERLKVDNLKKLEKENEIDKRRKSYEKFDIFICFLIYFAAQIGRNI